MGGNKVVNFLRKYMMLAVLFALVLCAGCGTATEDGNAAYTVSIVDQNGDGVIDKQGALIIPCEWDAMVDRIWPFNRGEIMQVGKDGLWGFINQQGELITGRLYAPETIQAEWYGEYLFLLENGVLSIWHADGTQVY